MVRCEPLGCVYVTHRYARYVPSQEDDFCIVIASDGVWELLTSDQVADIVFQVAEKDPTDVAKMVEAIVEQSSYMWKVEEGDYRDDITVIVLLFPWLPKEDGEAAE